MIMETRMMQQNIDTTVDGLKAFPVMHKTEDGQLNLHPEFTAMKPIQQRQENEEHPSQVLDINEDFNYYRYSWMTEPEQVSTTNYMVLGSLAAIIAVIVYFIVGTKLVKFIQFFLTKKQYRKLSIKIKPQAAMAVEAQSQEECQANMHQTPRNQKQSKNNTNEVINLLKVPTEQERSQTGLISNLSFHARVLMQFYAPFFATWQLIGCSKSVSLPGYVVVWQLLLRSVLLVTITVASCLVYMSYTLEDQERDCIFSRDMKSSSYYCLNEGGEQASQQGFVDVHKKSLYQMGAVCAIVGAVIMISVSQSIFKNFTKYLNRLIDDTHESKVNSRPALVKNITIEGVDSIRKKSPVKRKYDSISSFRAFLDSDSSMMHLQGANQDNSLQTEEQEHGYDSAAGQMSLSTQANLLNESNRGGTLNLSNQNSARCADPSNLVSKRANAPDLLPIDEDVDDEKCSPIKPKKRTKQDSPFKKIISAKKSHLIDGEDNLLVISSDDHEENKRGGFGLELDQQNNNSKEAVSFNLNSNLNSGGLNSNLETPNEQKSRYSPQKQYLKDQIASFSSQDLSCGNLQSQDRGFHLEIEKIPNPSADLRDHFQSLNSVGATSAFQRNNQKQTGITSEDTRNYHNNQHSIGNVGGLSSSQVDDSTLQLDSIVPVKPVTEAPSSTKNMEQNTRQGQQNNMRLLSVRQEENKQPALSVRHNGSKSDQLGQGMSLVTPFYFPQETHPISSQENQTEDNYQSLGAFQAKNNDILSSDRISNSMRPDSSGMPKNKSKKSKNEPPADFQIQPKESNSGQEDSSLYKQLKTLIIIIFAMAFVFGVCMDAYFMIMLRSQALEFIFQGLASAFIADLTIQIVVLIAFSALQYCYELKGKKLPFDTIKLRYMTSQTKQLARKVFSDYHDQSALLQVGYKDEEDLELEQIELDLEKASGQSNSLSSGQLSQQKVGPRDILIKESITTLSLDGLTVEVSETLKFRPPRAASRSSRINLIQPRSSVPAVQVGKLNNFQRSSRRDNIQTYERTQQFFAEQRPNAVSRFKGSSSKKKSSPMKNGQQKLRQSIENIELEHLENDFSKSPIQNKNNAKVKSQTPQKLKLNHAQSSLMGYSSSKKVSVFETPKAQLSQVKIKQHGTETMNASQKVNEKSDMKSSVRRKLIMKRNSHLSMEESKGKPSSNKKYLEDIDSNTHQDIIGIILNNSSKSIQSNLDVGKIIKGQKGLIVDSLPAPEGDGQDHFGVDLFESQDKELMDGFYNSRDYGVKQQQQNKNEPEQYSPIFSSQNRKTGAQKHMEAIIQKEKQKEQPALDQIQINLQGSNSLTKGQAIVANISRTVKDYARQNTCPPDLVTPMSASNEDSTNSKAVAAILSNREALSKAQSFNSPTSLHEQIQLTNEKIKNSLQKSSVTKGRRKMIMLDEAGPSKQSLNFGSSNQNAGSQQNKFQNIGSVLLNNGSSLDGSSNPVTPGGIDNVNTIINSLNPQGLDYLAQQQRSTESVFLQDQGLPDFIMDDKIMSPGEGLINSNKFNNEIVPDAPIVIEADQAKTQNDYIQKDKKVIAPQAVDKGNSKGQKQAACKPITTQSGTQQDYTNRSSIQNRAKRSSIPQQKQTERRNSIKDRYESDNSRKVKKETSKGAAGSRALKTRDNYRSDQERRSSIKQIDGFAKRSSLQSNMADNKEGKKKKQSESEQRPSKKNHKKDKKGGKDNKNKNIESDNDRNSIQSQSRGIGKRSSINSQKTTSNAKAQMMQSYEFKDGRGIGKRSSINSNQPTSNVKKQLETTEQKESQPPTSDVKNSSATSAFQRLVMASKRMMSKKSSEKKDAVTAKINPQIEAQARSQSQCMDTISLMKEQSQQLNNAIFAQPFRVTNSRKGQRSSTEPHAQGQTENENIEEQKIEKQLQQPVVLGDVKEQKESHKSSIGLLHSEYMINGLNILKEQFSEETTLQQLEDDIKKNKYDQISEILEQESMEIDTPFQPLRTQDISKELKIREQSSFYLVPKTLSTAQIDPLKEYNNLPIDETLYNLENQVKSILNIDKDVTITQDFVDEQSLDQVAQKSVQNKFQKSKKQIRQRKNSQQTTKNGAGMVGDQSLKMPRCSSKNGLTVPKTSVTQEKQQHKLATQSSRENTMSSVSIDFDKMDKERADDYSDYSKMISAGSTMSRVDDQRRRLESFLCLAQQAKSKKDISKIQDMIKQIDDSGKPLPMSKINELKLLELMASPYNQSLIAMIKVELDITKKIKELKKTTQQSAVSIQKKSKYQLPKHLSAQNSNLVLNKAEILKTDDSQRTFEKQFEVSYPQNQNDMSDNRLTTVVNKRPNGLNGISSCRSNNDVAPRTFNRSPQHMNQSPLSMGVCQPVITRAEKKHAGSSTSGRFGYLRNVGNAVLQDDVRQSVDRMRMSNEGHSKPQSTSDLVIDKNYEAEGRRGTAPDFDGQQCMSGLDYYRKQRLEGQPQSKSALTTEKENQAQPRVRNFTNNN